jgi:hypothetical protein
VPEPACQRRIDCHDERGEAQLAGCIQWSLTLGHESSYVE